MGGNDVGLKKGGQWTQLKTNLVAYELLKRHGGGGGVGVGVRLPPISVQYRPWSLRAASSPWGWWDQSKTATDSSSNQTQVPMGCSSTSVLVRWWLGNDIHIMEFTCTSGVWSCPALCLRPLAVRSRLQLPELAPHHDGDELGHTLVTLKNILLAWIIYIDNNMSWKTQLLEVNFINETE